MITIYWNEEQRKWLSVKTEMIVYPVKTGMIVDIEMSDSGWLFQLRRLGFKSEKIPYSENAKVVK